MSKVLSAEKKTEITLTGMHKSSRFMVLGIDGMDPEIFRFLHSKGKMPFTGAIADTGSFRSLATSTPPQRPVSWTNIARGYNAGRHGICVFLHRNPKTYTPQSLLWGNLESPFIKGFGGFLK